MLKSLAEHVLGFRSFMTLENGGEYTHISMLCVWKGNEDILIIYALLSRIFLSRFTNFFHRFFETEKQDPQAFIAFRMYVVMYGKKYFRSNSKISCSSSSGALTAVVLYFDCTLVLAPQAWPVHARRVHACVRARTQGR